MSWAVEANCWWQPGRTVASESDDITAIARLCDGTCQGQVGDIWVGRPLSGAFLFSPSIKVLDFAFKFYLITFLYQTSLLFCSNRKSLVLVLVLVCVEQLTFFTCLPSTLWHHVTVLQQADPPTGTPFVWRAHSWIDNLLHNNLVWTGGQIPADWNMWRALSVLTHIFPFLLRSLSSSPLPSLPIKSSADPCPSTALHTRHVCSEL